MKRSSSPSAIPPSASPLTVEVLRRLCREGTFRDGENLLRRGLVQDLVTETGEWGWRIRGVVREPGVPSRNASLEWDGTRLGGLCTCPQQSGTLCRHLVVVGLQLVAESTRSVSLPGEQHRWLEALGRTLPEAGPGPDEERITYHLTLEEGETPLLSITPQRLRPGRQPRLRPLEIDNLGTPLSCMTEVDRALLDVLLPIQLMGYRNRWFRPGRIRVPPELTDRVLRLLASGAEVSFGEKVEVINLSAAAARFQLVVTSGQPHGLELGGELQPPAGWLGEWPRPRLVVGRFPAWALVGDTFFPVENLPQPSVWTRFEEGICVPGAGLPRFAREVLPRLVRQGWLRPEEITSDIVPPTVGGVVPRPELRLWEQGHELWGELRFDYGLGSVTVPASDSREVVDGLRGAEPVWILRDTRAESEAAGLLQDVGLRESSRGLFVAEGEEILEFLLDGPSRLGEGWTLLGREGVERSHIVTAAPRFHVDVHTRDTWFEVDARAQFGEHSVPLTRLLECLRGRRRFVDLGDGHHAALPEVWLRRHQALLETLSAFSQGEGLKLPSRQLINLDLLLEGVDEYHCDTRYHEVLARLRGITSIPEVAKPEGLRAELRPYQHKGLEWLVFMANHGLSGILADDMGLGKTVQTLALICHRRETQPGRPSLVICPTSVVYGWQQEASRVVPGLKVVMFHGTQATRQELRPQLENYDLVVTSYAVLRRELETLSAIPFDLVVLDEAQNIKNPGSVTSRSARTLRADARLALTGTPIENHAGELWSIFAFLMPGLLGSLREFQSLYVHRGDDTFSQLGELRKRVQPFILRRLKATVATDLPPRTEVQLDCDLLPAQRDLYLSVLRATRARVMEVVEHKGLERSHLTVLEGLLRLRQVCCHPQLLPLPEARGIPSAKLERFLELLRDILEGGHRVLVFSQFTQMLALLQKALDGAGIPWLGLDGRTRDRAARVEKFNSDMSIPVFLISLKAGGSGLNLTTADYVIHFDPWWNPAVEDQATDRAHRIGQTRPVFAYRLITRGTVEEKILALQASKRRVATGVLEEEGNLGQVLTRDDLDYLFGDPGELSDTGMEAFADETVMAE